MKVNKRDTKTQKKIEKNFKIKNRFKINKLFLYINFINFNFLYKN